MIKGKKLNVFFATVVLLLFSSVTYAQQDGVNVASPYTLYGIGQLNSLGSAYNKGMGGAGLALKSRVDLNGLNPASYSEVPQQTFLFSFGAASDNSYLSGSDATTSYNSFNISDIGFQFPLAKRLGFGFILNPYSSVGYNLTTYNNSDEMSASVGQISSLYSGTGGVSLMKAGIGWEPIKGLSVGASMLFYHGTIERSSSTAITNNIMTSETYRMVKIEEYYQFSQLSGEFGLIYQYAVAKNKNISAAVTYQPKVSASADVITDISTISTYTIDSVYYGSKSQELVIPQKFAAGIGYSTLKLQLALDYTYQDYTNSYDMDNAAENGVELSAYQNVSFGMSYTPDVFGVKSPLQRWNYRAGAKYSTNYLMVNDQPIGEWAITAGLGIPLQKAGFSKFNLGVEAGQRIAYGNSSLKETYFNVSLGFSFFVEREWFVRHKFR